MAKITSLALACALAFAFTGCKKRPHPPMTQYPSIWFSSISQVMIDLKQVIAITNEGLDNTCVIYLTAGVKLSCYDASMATSLIQALRTYHGYPSGDPYR